METTTGTKRPFASQLASVGINLRDTDVSGCGGLLWTLYTEKRDRKRVREVLPVRGWDPEGRQDEPTVFWTKEMVMAVRDSRCDCAVCVVYGGDCPAALQADERDTVLSRYIRGMNRARARKAVGK
jgi:hypothetical protein